MAQTTVKSLENMLNYCAQKQKILSKNIANIGTDNYKREDLKFESVLNENISGSLKVTNQKHFTSTGPGTNDNSFKIIEDNDPEKASGINNVDIDTEMAEMAENALKYKFAAKKIGDYFRGIQQVIKGDSR